MRKIAVSIIAILVVVSMSIVAVGIGKSYIEDDCGQEKCSCFVQLGDSGGFVKGIIERLYEQGYLKNKKRAQFTEEVEQAVIQFQEDNDLPATGMMDDDTLTLLIWGQLPEELDVSMPINPKVEGTFPDMVYIPTDGGKKRHSDPLCSDMYNPRKVSIRNAAALKYDACKKCEDDREVALKIEYGH